MSKALKRHRWLQGVLGSASTREREETSAMRIVVTLLLAANLGQGGIFILEDGEASRVPVCAFVNRVEG